MYMFTRVQYTLKIQVQYNHSMKNNAYKKLS